MSWGLLRTIHGNGVLATACNVRDVDVGQRRQLLRSKSDARLVVQWLLKDSSRTCDLCDRGPVELSCSDPKYRPARPLCRVLPY
jgi:hypothetical protein